ncbi:tyrosine-type recombinase/integrase [Vreelandella sp. H-I2]
MGRPDIRFHDMRHCYASLLASKGESLTSIRDLLGHSSLTVTNRYAHADPTRWNSVVASLPRIGNQALTKRITNPCNQLILLVVKVGIEPMTK